MIKIGVFGNALQSKYGAYIRTMDDKTLFTVLSCAEKTDGQVGRSGILKILLGGESRKLAKLKLDHLEEYGSLSFMRREVVLEHIDYLIERGCLNVSSFFFPMVDLTNVGRERKKKLVQKHGLRVLPEKPVASMADREIREIHVCDEVEFWYLFPQDLNSAKHEIIIVSPFVTRRRAERFMKDFQQFTERGVQIQIYVRPLEGNKRREDAILNTWEAMGVEVVYREDIHQKAAIIDRTIAWAGSLNILQHWDSGEQMTRHEDPEYIQQLTNVLDLKQRGDNK